MTWDDLGLDAEKKNRGDRDRWIGVYIGVLAVMLAICGLGGGNATKDSTLKNIEASNTWGFFQAKNARRQSLRLQTDQLELMLETSLAMPEEARGHLTTKIAEYKAQDKKLTSDPEKSEGLDELFARGKALEAERDRAMRRDPYFDYGQALLQIAIVLASVAIVSGGSAVLIGSAILGVLGALATFGGFTLAFPLPF